MRKFLFLLIGVFITTAASSQDHWRQVVGLPDDCTNPVFTRPNHMHSSNTVQGAGINMNDGEAYTTRTVELNHDEHMAPKLPLCEQELAVIPRVLGLYVTDITSPRVLAPLKCCVRTHHGCGAVVVYRCFDSYRYINTQYENLEQFIAVYDDKGNLTDCMMMGYHDDMADILGIEPHKSYKVGNAGSSKLEFDETGDRFTISCTSRLKEVGEGVPEKIEWQRSYTITSDGKIRLEKVSNNALSQVANSAAIDMMEVIYAPMSDTQLLSKLDKAWAKLANNELVGDRVMHLGMLIYNRNPKAFLSYVYKNRAKTSLTKLLKRAKKYKGPGLEYDECLATTIAKHSPSPKAKKWLKARIK